MSNTGATIQLVTQSSNHDRSNSACYPAGEAPAPAGREQDDAEEILEESDP